MQKKDRKISSDLKKTGWIIYVLFFAVIILAAFIRFYKLADYPVILSHDEVSQLYDAMSILKTGKDIYGQKLPFIFTSINDFKPPFYTYATIPFLYIFGTGEIVIRIVGALFGTFLIAAVYFFTLKLFSNKYFSLLSAFFTAITPFEIHFSRKGFEGVIGLTLLLIGFGILISFLSSKKNQSKFIIGSVIVALSMYTYFSYAIVVPILYIFFLVLLFKNKVSISKLGIISFIVVILPLLIFIIKDKNSSSRTEAVVITQDSRLINIININLKKDDKFYSFKKYILIARYSLIRYMDQLNPTFLFINGLDLSNQDPFDIGPFYIYQFPLLLIGFVYLFKKYKVKKKILYFILVWILIGLLPSGLSFETHSPHRILMVLTMFNIIAAFGAYILLRKFIDVCQQKNTRFLFGILTIFIIVWSFAYFVFVYSIDYPIDKSEFIQFPYKEVALTAKEYYNDYDQIIFDPKFGKDMPWVGGAVQYYLAYYGDFPVENMQKEYIVTEGDKSKVTFGKYIIRSVYWPEDKRLNRTLLIASHWVISKETFGDAKLLKEIRSYQGNTIAFYVLSLK